MSKYSDETRKRLSEFQKQLWSDPEYAAKRIELIRNTKRNFGEEFGTQARDRLQSLWNDPNWKEHTRASQSAGAKARWADPVKRAEFLEKRRIAREKRKKESE